MAGTRPAFLSSSDSPRRKGAFVLSRDEQTARLLRALDNPHLAVLAHPTGRLIGRREPYAVDMEKVIHHAARRGCFLELNGSPDRLDLDDKFCRLAKREGVLVSLNSDAHRLSDFDNLAYACSQARRAWLEPQDVLNARPLQELSPLLKSAFR